MDGRVAVREAGLASFQAFYRAHAQRVIALAVALTADRSAGEDLAQEAFARTFQRWDRVAGYDDPGAWVRRVVVNLSHSRWRRLRVERRALGRLGGAPEWHVELTEPASEVWGAVRRLPAGEAAAVALFYVDDLSVAEVAAILDVAEGTVKSRLHQARRRLAEMLEGYSHEH